MPLNICKAFWQPNSALAVNKYMSPFTINVREKISVPIKPIPTGFKTWIIPDKGYFLHWSPKNKNCTKHIALTEFFYITLTHSIGAEAAGIPSVLPVAGSVTAADILPPENTMLVAENSDREYRVAAAAAASAKVKYWRALRSAPWFEGRLG